MCSHFLRAHLLPLGEDCTGINQTLNYTNKKIPTVTHFWLCSYVHQTKTCLDAKKRECTEKLLRFWFSCLFEAHIQKTKPDILHMIIRLQRHNLAHHQPHSHNLTPLHHTGYLYCRCLSSFPISQVPLPLIIIIIIITSISSISIILHTSFYTQTHHAPDTLPCQAA